MRHTNHTDLCHGGMAVQHILNLGGIDVLASRDDHVLETVEQKDMARLIKIGRIAAAEPATLQDGLAGSGLIAPIALHEHGRAQPDLTHRTCRHILMGGGIDNTQFDPWQRLAARFQKRDIRAFGIVLVWPKADHGARTLGHAVSMHELTSQRSDGAAQQHITHGRCTIHQQFHAGEICPRHIRRIQNALHHRRHHERMRHPIAWDQIQDGGDVHITHQHSMPARQHRAAAIAAAPDMKERHRHQIDAGIRHAPCRSQLACVGHALIRQHHALWQAGGAGRIKQQGYLIRRPLMAGVLNRDGITPSGEFRTKADHVDPARPALQKARTCIIRKDQRRLRIGKDQHNLARR